MLYSERLQVYAPLNVGVQVIFAVSDPESRKTLAGLRKQPNDVESAPDIVVDCYRDGRTRPHGQLTLTLDADCAPSYNPQNGHLVNLRVLDPRNEDAIMPVVVKSSMVGDKDLLRFFSSDAKQLERYAAQAALAAS